MEFGLARTVHRRWLHCHCTWIVHRQYSVGQDVLRSKLEVFQKTYLLILSQNIYFVNMSYIRLIAVMVSCSALCPAVTQVRWAFGASVLSS